MLIFELAEELTKVAGQQVYYFWSYPGNLQDENRLRNNGRLVDIGAFRRGEVKPEGVLVLFTGAYEIGVRFYELTPAASANWRAAVAADAAKQAQQPLATGVVQ